MGIDPIGMVVDFVAEKALGDSEYKNLITSAVKVGVGAMTGDVLLVGEGAVGFAGSALDKLPAGAATEYLGPAAAGFAMGGAPGAIGAILIAGYLKPEPKPASTSQAVSRRGDQQVGDPGTDTKPASSGDGRDAVGGASTTKVTKTVNEEVRLDLAEYVNQAATIAIITPEEMQKAMFKGGGYPLRPNPDANKELGQLIEQKLLSDPAARQTFEATFGLKLELEKDPLSNGFVFAMKSKQVEETVETAEQKPVPDGVGGADVGEVDDEVEAEETETESKPAKTDDAHRFDGMSAEEIVEAIMNDMIEGIDDEVVETAKDLEKAQNKANKGKDQKDGGAAKAQRSADQLSLKMQKLMEKRKAMFEMLTNMSRIFSDMAKAAISNMGRA